MDFNKIPKKFCENVNIASSAEFFVITLASGEEISAYALTPQHAKRLVQSLSYNVSEFERKFGEIKAEWSPGIQSPIQINNIKGDKNKGKK